MKGSKQTRREFLGSLAAAGLLTKGHFAEPRQVSKIDRFSLVLRHNPILRKFEPLSPLSVGNGEFAFTCDITGLQTFPDLYKDAMPLCTMSQWGWHTMPRPSQLAERALRLTEYETYGRKVGYPTDRKGQEELFDWLRENPHRLHLGQIGFRLIRADGSEGIATDITDVEQTLDLWTGRITSQFRFQNREVKVRTAAHPTVDLLAVSVESRLVAEEKLAIRFAFPYGASSMQAADWAQAYKHRSTVSLKGFNSVAIKRSLDEENYHVNIDWANRAKFVNIKAHEFLLEPEKSERIDFTINFGERPAATRVEPATAFAKAESHWKEFWTDSAAIELIESKDKRAPELERRIVLSQYLTAIQCSGSVPPQETGLTCNSWYGKYHLEMHWWHAAHFALWGRLPMLEKSLDWYAKILPSAKEKAKQQGYIGARWPKMTAPDGRDSPSPIGPLLIWQQPHPIFYAELVYLSRPTHETLKKYQSIVFESAEFMASFAHFNSAMSRYVLGPPVIPAQENHPPRETWNPTFELEYWNFGLRTANRWRERLGQRRMQKWDDVANRLSHPPVRDGVYLAHENCPQTFTERNRDHPSMLAAYGVLTGETIDREIMRRTLREVMKDWDWAETWGWDYPMTAMTAARLGETETAVTALLLDTPKNRYLSNGHNYQRPNLPCYLPGNGGLLYAIALMANGWKDAPQGLAPGFPVDGSWTVRSEGFNINLFSQI
jgi:hypothetical protein